MGGDISGPVELHYLTGTGNTYRVAEWLADAARDRGLAVRLAPIASAEATLATPGPGGMIGVLFPTHGFTAPWPVIRHLVRLPRLDGRRAVVIATRGATGWAGFRVPGFEGTGTWLAALVLAVKGAKVVGITGVDMPANWTAIHPGLRPGNVADIVEGSEVRVRAFTEAVLDGRTTYRGWAALLFGILLVPASLGYLIVARRLLGKLFLADERCTSCGICVRTCPFGANRMAGRPRQRPYWTWRCESCMRCMNVCPENAVQAWQPGLAAIILGSSAVGATATMALTLGGLQRFGAAATLAAQVLGLALLLGGWSVCYAALWWASRYPPAAWFFGHTTLTRIYRRYHEPGTDLRRV